MNNEFNNQNPVGVNPEPVVQPQPVVTPEPMVQPQPVVTPEPMVQPQPVVTPEPVIQPQPMATQPVGEVKPKKKKPIALIVIVLLLLVAGAGVGAYFFLFNGKASSPDSIAKSYIQNLINKKYNDNYDNVFMTDNRFIDTNDYSEFAQTEQKYNDISTKKIGKLNEKLKTEENATYDVELVGDNDHKSTIEVKLKFVDNKWKVVEDNFYVSNWEFKTVSGATVYIDDVEVPRSYIKDDSSTSMYYEKYSIPALTKTKKTFVFRTEIGESSEDFTPLSSNSGQVFHVILTNSDLVNRAHDYIKTTWNNMYKDSVNKADVSEIKTKYFDGVEDIDSIDKYYKDLKSLTSDHSSQHQILEVISRPKNDNYVCGNDIIFLNFGYKMSWVDYAGTWYQMNEDMTRWSTIYLKIDGDSFKIQKISDEKLFSWVNPFTHDYRNS